MRRLFGCLVRLLVLGAIAVVLIYFFAPPLWDKIGSSLINSIDANSAVSGLVQVVPANFSGSGSSLQVTLQGLTPNGTYYITLDPDACPSTAFVQDIGQVVADSSGNVVAQLKIPDASTLGKRVWWVDVHIGTAGGFSVACGKLQFNSSTLAQDATPTPLDTGSGSFSVNLGPVTPTAVPATDTTPNATNQQSNGATTTPPKGWPNTGVNPGDQNSYKNDTYPRKF